MEKPATRRILAENLRIIRMVRHLSQEGLAELADLDRSYVSSLERAEVNIGLDNLEKLAVALEVSMVDLLTKPDPAQVGDEIVEAVRGAVDRKRGVREEAEIYLVAPMRVLGHCHGLVIAPSGAHG